MTPHLKQGDKPVCQFCHKNGTTLDINGLLLCKKCRKDFDKENELREGIKMNSIFDQKEMTDRELLIDIHIRIMDIQSRIPPSKEEIDISGFKKPMHDIQKKLIIANKKGLLIGKGYRGIAKLVGISHPQQVKHHLQQLKKHHLI